MVLRQFIKCGIDHFYIIADNRFFNICDFLRPLIDEKDQDMNLRVIFLNGMCHALQKRCLTCFWRRDDHTSLSLADRRHQIKDPHGHVLFGCFQAEPLIRKDRCQILKVAAVQCLAWKHAVDAVQMKERAELFILCFYSDFSF